ncbi:MAG: hypothetical protein QME42_01155 [bacterium]|nr:hypothetical protein [bacterium]
MSDRTKIPNNLEKFTTGDTEIITFENPRRKNKHEMDKIENIVAKFRWLKNNEFDFIICLDNKCDDDKCQNNGKVVKGRPYCYPNENTRKKLNDFISSNFKEYYHKSVGDPAMGQEITDEDHKWFKHLVNDLRSKGIKKIAVHCGAGIDRSPSIRNEYLKGNQK